MCTLECDAFALTDCGRVRSSNQDQFLVAELGPLLHVAQSSLPDESLTDLNDVPHARLLLVADGVGGHAGGSEASTLAVCAVAEYVAVTMPWVLSYSQEATDEVAQVLQYGVRRTNATVLEASQERPDCAGMGTTLTMAYVDWPLAYIAHVGDSRCYLLRSGHLHRLTTDQTLANQLAEAQAGESAQMQGSQFKDILVNVVGGGSESVEPAMLRAELQPDDCLLLCSDGLTKQLQEGEIQQRLASQQTAKAASESLVSAANSRGGSDNVTVVVARFVTRPVA